MTKNDRLQQIISNVRQMSDLANSMNDSEMYPVSFFSQAFDLIQKLQSDFHTLEAEQVEMFAEQLKKHQALILSIHQQMRHFSTQTQNMITKVTSPVIPEDNQIISSPSPRAAESVKTLSETNEIIIKSEPVAAPPEAPAEKPMRPAPPEAPAEKPMRPAPPEAPVEKPMRPAPPEAPAIQRPSRPLPPEAPATIQRPPRPAPPAVAQEPDSEAHGIPPIPASVNSGTPVIRNEMISSEAPAPSTLNDRIEKKNLSDLRKAFSLNDHFRYRKELFNGSEEMMNRVIGILNNHHSLKESISFLEQKLHWDFNELTVKDFVKKLEMRFD